MVITFDQSFLQWKTTLRKLIELAGNGIDHMIIAVDTYIRLRNNATTTFNLLVFQQNVQRIVVNNSAT